MALPRRSHPSIHPSRNECHAAAHRELDVGYTPCVYIQIYYARIIYFWPSEACRARRVAPLRGLEVRTPPWRRSSLVYTARPSLLNSSPCYSPFLVLEEKKCWKVARCRRRLPGELWARSWAVVSLAREKRNRGVQRYIIHGSFSFCLAPFV